MLTKQHEEFHAHLDECTQCANQPFNLCPAGDGLIKAAVASITAAPQWLDGTPRDEMPRTFHPPVERPKIGLIGKIQS